MERTFTGAEYIGRLTLRSRLVHRNCDLMQLDRALRFELLRQRCESLGMYFILRH